ncbi:hypothetical protein AC578_10313 [Pseudocercospora eumusae]|uniref:FAD-binding domain-containing protein n=1 Tax=Pseudocercospora eumusae TaxID=321146 RepID=A0A139HRB7_9PEZI|nr:hypothetical protein AC578_10313 [Pseudocercospora eumusae]
MGSAGQPVRVAIAGGGIAGLALAAGLSKHPNIDWHVYESVPEHKDVGAGLALHMNAIKAMGLIGDEVKQTYFDRAVTIGEEDEEMVTEVILAQGPHTGECVAELGRAKGRKTIARAELLRGLMELIPKERVKFGKRVKSIEESGSMVTVEFEDGEKVQADCLIGADGMRSPTRSYILGADHPATAPKNHEGWHIYRRMMPIEKAVARGINPKWTKYVPIFLGPKGHVNSITLDKGKRINVGVAIRGAKFSKTGEAPPLNPEDYSDYSDEAKLFVSMVAEDVNMQWTAADHDHAPVYYRGNVCMIGDAAHTMYGFAGNGAAQALEDCAVLTHLFSNVTDRSQLEAVFRAYDGARRPRSQAVVDQTRKYGRVYAYAEPELKNNVEGMRDFFNHGAAFTNNADLVKQNEDAMKLFESYV